MDLALKKPPGHRESLHLQALSSISSRLERISDLLLNLDRQAGYLSRLSVLESYDLGEFFGEILYGLERIYPALVNRDVTLAVKLGQAEERLDAYYAARFARLINEFGPGRSPGDLVTVLMIVHYLERIGDMLLEIGEKIIYVIMGERIKLEQYKALGQGLRAAGAPDQEPATLDFHSIWGGRSGCRIGVVGPPGDPQGAESGQTVLFKHGPASKLTRERENLDIWASLRPGLTPKVKAFIPAQAGTEAALMMEFIPSRTLQALFLESSSIDALAGLKKALEAVIGVWRDTTKASPIPSDFCRQVEERLPESATVHPRLFRRHGSIGSFPLKTVTELLSEAKALEATLFAPFSARIHGDFNLSNLLYDSISGKMAFVDLYRSREADYVQDVSVMLISIIRLPVAGYQAREGLSRAARLAESIFRRFALEMGDETFDARLAFGLARSFVTSTRFVLDDKLAGLFLARTRYLWHKLFEHGRKNLPWTSFKFSLSILDVSPD
ncbi:MAG: phosphotransferase [Deltaproteobacteria bacterium]|nr:phosphotransferase [Deltaproteobacteria bacterium]